MPETLRITPEERKALQKFKERLIDVTPNKVELLEDRRLVNWLRARNLKLDNAEAMFRKHLEWRQEHEIDTILTKNNINMEDPVIFNLPVDIVGEDKEGNIILAVHAANVEIKKIAQNYKKELCMEVIYFLLETAYAEIEKRSSSDPSHFKKAVYIVDIEGLNFKEYLSSEVLDILISSLKVVEANYPELLFKAFVLNTPFIFPVLWNILKPFLSPKTLDKVNIIGQNQDKIQSSLLELIDTAQLPRKWGGTGYSERIPALNVASSMSKADSCGKDLLETVISAGDSFELTYEVENPKALLSWVFKTKNYDIGFSLSYKPSAESASTSSSINEADVKERVEYKRVSTNKGMQSGSLVCEMPGQYILRFDNTYSRFREKTLMYHVELTPLTLNGNFDKSPSMNSFTSLAFKNSK